MPSLLIPHHNDFHDTPDEALDAYSQVVGGAWQVRLGFVDDEAEAEMLGAEPDIGLLLLQSRPMEMALAAGRADGAMHRYPRRTWILTPRQRASGGRAT